MIVTFLVCLSPGWVQRNLTRYDRLVTLIFSDIVNQLLSEIQLTPKCYDTKNVSDEANAINPNYSHILDYCKFFDIFTPWYVSISTFSVC